MKNHITLPLQIRKGCLVRIFWDVWPITWTWQLGDSLFFGAAGFGNIKSWSYNAFPQFVFHEVRFDSGHITNLDVFWWQEVLEASFFNFTPSIDHAWGCHPANTKSRRQRSGKVCMAFHCHFQISWKVTGQICGLRLFHLLRLLARTLQESIEWMSKRYQTVAWITVYRYRAAS